MMYSRAQGGRIGAGGQGWIGAEEAGLEAGGRLEAGLEAGPAKGTVSHLSTILDSYLLCKEVRTKLHHDMCLYTP